MPKFRDVTIVWHDGDQPYLATVCIDPEHFDFDFDDDFDDPDVFFYFTSEDEFQSAKNPSKNNGFDFYIVEEW